MVIPCYWKVFNVGDDKNDIIVGQSLSCRECLEKFRGKINCTILDSGDIKPYYGYKYSYRRVVADENEYHSRGKKQPVTIDSSA